MQAVAIAEFGASDRLRLEQRPLPQWGAGEVLIRVHASGVNRPDILQRLGKYPPPAGVSDIPGLELAGVIEDGDPEALAVSGFALGDSVCALVAGGGYAEYCVAPLAQCLPVPSGFSMLQAAALPETFFTVWSNVFDRAKLQAGEWLLVQGGSSGIGTVALQLGKAFGAKVVVTAGSDAKCAACLQLGADYAINYRTQDFELEVAHITDGCGVDVVLDMVAGPYLAREVRSMAEDGRIVIISSLGGKVSDFETATLYRKRIAVTGSALRARKVDFKAAIAQQLRQRVWPLLESGQVVPVLYRVFPVEEVASAHALMEHGSHIGKIMLSWGARLTA